ncbi:MAG: AAA family ATPase, partial [Pseudomonadota bacterium]
MSGPREKPGAGFRRLTLTNFRSYGYADIRFDGRPVTFAGPNGAGKTNLLEAISLLGPGRGLRGAKLVDMVKSGGAASF